MSLLSTSLFILYLWLGISSLINPFSDLEYTNQYNLKLIILCLSTAVIPFCAKRTYFLFYRPLFLYLLVLSPIAALLLGELFIGNCDLNRSCFIIGGVNTIPTIYSYFCLIIYINYIHKIGSAYQIIFSSLGQRLLALSIFVLLFISIVASSRTSIIFVFISMAIFFANLIIKALVSLADFKISRLAVAYLVFCCLVVLAISLFSSTYMMIGFDVFLHCSFLDFLQLPYFSGLPKSYICSTATVRIEWFSALPNLTIFGNSISRHWDVEIVSLLNNGGLIALFLGFLSYVFLFLGTLAGSTGIVPKTLLVFYLALIALTREPLTDTITICSIPYLIYCFYYLNTQTRFT